DNMAVWYMGYTPDLVAASMIAGADNNGQPIPLSGQTIEGQYITSQGAAGSALAGPMWIEAMGTIQEYLPGHSIARPPHSKHTPPARASSGGSGNSDNSNSSGDDDDDDDDDDD